MSSSIGRNSLIMATGTAASRITGQLRTILLAAALGTTGITANAYQAGSTIPQVVFTLVSGGIFNAVLVPQIVRTMKHHDAQDRLNRLITFAVVLLAGVTAIMAAATALLTRLYADGGPDMIALTSAFTLWCMPQVFFYGLYTVLGQILAAKGHFGTYAWSSAGANVISCVGFAAFIAMFGHADRQPLTFWTSDRLALTAGMWTVGVAFQALVLFLPLTRIGLRYRPRWGLGGFGLRSMGPVAAWSVGVVLVTQLITIVATRITTAAPDRAAALLGADQFDVAGNASYQNAYTIYILPYSLIAVSVSTAIFPKISQSIAERDTSMARRDLSASIRHVGVLMCFFTVAFLVMPLPIILTLLPSVDVHAAQLMAGPLAALSFTLPLTSAYLIIQRTFYAFEDGKRPFLFMVLQAGIQWLVLQIGTHTLPPTQWALLTGLSVSVSYVLAFPALVWMLRKRFGGHLDGRRIGMAYAKTVTASVVAGAIGLWLREPAYHMVGAHVTPEGGTMRWPQAVMVCLLLTIAITIAYLGTLVALRTDELMAVALPLIRRTRRTTPRTATGMALPAGTAPAIRTASAPAERDDDGQRGRHGAAGNAADATTTIPTDRMPTTPQSPHPPSAHGIEGSMTLQPAHTVINRYTLMTLLREGPGLQAWIANDRLLARDCQLFIVTNSDAVDQVTDIASSLALARSTRFTDVLQIHNIDGAAVVITRVDAGTSLTDYLAAHDAHPLSFAAVRTVLGETAAAARKLPLSTGLPTALGTDTVRLTRHGVQIADAAIGPLLADMSDAPDGMVGERLATRQLSSVAYAMLTRRPCAPDTIFDLADLPENTPEDLRLICARGLELRDGQAPAIALGTLSEAEALLGDWQPLTSLGAADLALPGMDGTASIAHAPLLLAHPDSILPLPEALTDTSTPSMPSAPSMPKTDKTDKTSGRIEEASTARPTLSSRLTQPAWASATPQDTTLQAMQNGRNHGLHGETASTSTFDDGSGRTGARERLAAALGTVCLAFTTAAAGLGRWWHAVALKLGSSKAAPEVSANEDVPDTNHAGHTHHAGTEANRGTDLRDVAVAEMTGILKGAATDDDARMLPAFATREADGTHSTMRFDRSRMHADIRSTSDDASVLPHQTGRIALAQHDPSPSEDTGTMQPTIPLTLATTESAGTVAPPPSFAPRSPHHAPVRRSDEETATDESVADARLFGSLTTKVIIIAVVCVLVIVALLAALRGLPGLHRESVAIENHGDRWSSMNLEDVPFGNRGTTTEGADGSHPSDGKTSPTHDDKSAQSVPAAAVPENANAYEIDNRQFLTNPAGQNGLAYSMHLSQPQTVQRFVITIRSAGGKGYLRANTANDPTKGTQVAEFTFDQSGTTEVRFTPATAQDFLLWVPMDSLPGNALYIDKVELY